MKIRNANVNNTGDLSVSFRYSAGSEDPTKTNIRCGYVDQDTLSTIFLVRKEGTNNPVYINNGHLFAGRVSSLNNVNNQNIIGFKLQRVLKTDPTSFNCQASFVDAGSVTDSDNSELLKVTVLG